MSDTEKKKSHWGIGVIAAYAVFIIGIMTLVFISMSQQIDLVSEKYYDQGITYQTRIDAMKNSASLKDNVSIENTSSDLLLRFPRQFSRNDITGTITLYRPDNKASDAHVEISLDTAWTQQISSANFHKGLWRVKVDWAAAGSSYYFEQPLIIQ